MRQEEEEDSSLRPQGQRGQHRAGGEGRIPEQEASETTFLKKVKGQVGRHQASWTSNTQS